nr:bromodomain and WD repeat-containing protein 3-like [Pelodiscus sinensis]|eukprot:XP_025043192.1 bromodomain and WD repeat-containing protein 3-like [Pelodiscus sinensis]
MTSGVMSQGKEPSEGGPGRGGRPAEGLGQGGGGQRSGMAGRGSSRMISFERRNQALMEKIKSLQVANANLRYMNLRLKEENEVFKSTEEVIPGTTTRSSRRSSS